MRLWSIHPKYLDCRGLVALWREALLARAVLRGRTKGYRNHPQLERFRNHPHPRRAIAAYLEPVWREARRRGYRFDRAGLKPCGRVGKVAVPAGQVRFEFELLRQKTGRRDVGWCRSLPAAGKPAVHPLFRVVRGGIAAWERLASGSNPDRADRVDRG